MVPFQSLNNHAKKDEGSDVKRAPVLSVLPDAHRAAQKLLSRQLAALRHAAEPARERQWTCFLVVLGALGRSMQAEKRAFLARVAAARGLDLPKGSASPAGEHCT